MNLTRGFRSAGRFLSGTAWFAAAVCGAYVGVGWLRHARGTGLGRGW